MRCAYWDVGSCKFNNKLAFCGSDLLKCSYPEEARSYIYKECLKEVLQSMLQLAEMLQDTKEKTDSLAEDLKKLRKERINGD